MSSSFQQQLTKLQVDPRTETSLWIGVTCPLVYGVAHDGFNISPGSSLALSLIWGLGLWSYNPELVKKAFNMINARKQVENMDYDDLHSVDKADSTLY